MGGQTWTVVQRGSDYYVYGPPATFIPGTRSRCRCPHPALHRCARISSPQVSFERWATTVAKKPLVLCQSPEQGELRERGWITDDGRVRKESKNVNVNVTSSNSKKPPKHQASYRYATIASILCNCVSKLLSFTCCALLGSIACASVSTHFSAGTSAFSVKARMLNTVGSVRVGRKVFEATICLMTARISDWISDSGFGGALQGERPRYKNG